MHYTAYIHKFTLIFQLPIIVISYNIRNFRYKMNKQKHAELLEDFLKCLNDERYYDAHVALEEIWFPRRFEDNDEVRLLKGFINASVSFELEKRGRSLASKKVWKNYVKYRQLLYKIDSFHINNYTFIIKEIEKIKNSIYK